MPKPAQTLPFVARQAVMHASALTILPPSFEELEIPYYDSELNVAQSPAHMVAIAYLLPFIEMVARETGLRYRSDNAVHYPLLKDKNKIRFADLILARETGEKDTHAADLLWEWLASQSTSQPDPAASKAAGRHFRFRGRVCRHGR